MYEMTPFGGVQSLSLKNKTKQKNLMVKPKVGLQNSLANNEVFLYFSGDLAKD